MADAVINAGACAGAFRLLVVAMVPDSPARTMPDPVASTQRPAMVATLQGDPICATLTKFRPLVPYCCSNGKGREPGAANPANHTMQAFTLTAKLSALFGGSLLALFVAGLAVEDQRHFVACRASGASADACLLQISGR
jgi:hypothetical protein